ncbi:hypothetical protein C0V72_05900 [Porphyrobacter sp. TH134]|uniref:hypothetical protein n=1 Tax=Porphyrobacter sp. TH134 TaxID=2067450 RepID=UPI000C797F9D|nr:hypothetical protein [Porphyrobacter sp. TH134]PLK24106.1 hypothetical protein C0V72_05900 [Porphyrobacter sp. TH134]
MSLLSFVGCWLNHHKPDRRKVEWDGRGYVGHCRHCGVAIERHSRRNWRRQKPAGDHSHNEPTAT